MLSDGCIRLWNRGNDRLRLRHLDLLHEVLVVVDVLEDVVGVLRRDLLRKALLVLQEVEESVAEKLLGVLRVVGGDGHLAHLLYQLPKQELLLSVLTARVLLLLLLLLLQDLADRLHLAQLDHVVLVSVVVTRSHLVRCVSPVAIHSELVLVPPRLQHLCEDVSCSSLSKARTHGHSQTSANLHGLSLHDLLHLFTLPIVELAADLDVFAAEAPFEDVFNFGEE